MPYLGYQAVGVRGTAFDAYANYNSMQATVRKQFSHGFTFQGAYTWSKTMTVEYNDVANSNYAGNLAQQYGPATFSRPQRFVANYSYDLPFGTHTGVLQKVLGGWNVSGVTVVQGGSPMTIADQTAGTLFGTSGTSQAGFGRVQIAPGMTYADIVTPGSVEAAVGWRKRRPRLVQQGCLHRPASDVADWNCLLLRRQAVPDRRNAPRRIRELPAARCTATRGSGIITGPGQFNFDISILKTTKIFEKQTLQFRAEFFNAFNHPQFTNPNFGQGAIYALPNFAAGNFGQITSTSVNPRIIQLALKYIF